MSNAISVLVTVFSHKTPYETKSLDNNNFQIKWNLKKVKTVTDRLRNSLQNNVFTFFKFHFVWKLLISKLLVSYGVLCERVR